MVEIGLTADFKCQVLQWDGNTVHMKETHGLLGQSKLTKRNMCEVVMHTSESYPTRESTELLDKTLEISYEHSDLKQLVDNETQRNAEGRTLLLSLLEDFEDFFDVTLGYWATEPVDLDLNQYSKPFNSKYYPVPRINKENFENISNA